MSCSMVFIIWRLFFMNNSNFCFKINSNTQKSQNELINQPMVDNHFYIAFSISTRTRDLFSFFVPFCIFLEFYGVLKNVFLFSLSVNWLLWWFWEYTKPTLPRIWITVEEKWINRFINWWTRFHFVFCF